MTRLRKRSAFRPRVIQPQSPDDTRGPTPERVRLAQGFVERGNLGRGRTGVVTLRDSPIERALARSVISQAQYTAAVKYRHHWYRAGLASPTCISLRKMAPVSCETRPSVVSRTVRGCS